MRERHWLGEMPARPTLKRVCCFSLLPPPPRSVVGSSCFAVPPPLSIVGSSSVSAVHRRFVFLLRLLLFLRCPLLVPLPPPRSLVGSSSSSAVHRRLLLLRGPSSVPPPRSIVGSSSSAV